MKTAYLGLGSNLDDRRRNLAEAVRRLGLDAGLRVTAISSVYESKPVGKTDQGNFLNLVLAIATSHEPANLLARCLQIEAEMGRVRLERWGPRNIDIDVLCYEGAEVESSDLTLPHPRMLERCFVMFPLAEIVPQMVLHGETIATLASRLEAIGIKRVGTLASPSN